VCAGDDLPNHILEVGGRSYAEYLAGRPGKLRSTIKRKAGKLTIELIDRFAEEVWNTYEDIYANSWKPAEFQPEFLRNFGRREGAAGRLRMGIARAGGVPVAAQLWTVESGTAYIHKLSHTGESAALSPGTVLSAALFERVIDHDRVSRIDFGTGDDGYKPDWMESIRQRVGFDLIDPRRPRNWAAILTDVLGLKPGQAAAFTPQTELFGALPELDSMAVAGLLTEIEDRAGIIVEDDEVDGELLETYGSLLAFVRAKRAGA